MTKIPLFAFELDEPEFKLDIDFIDAYRGRQPKWGSIGYVVYKRTYARRKPDGTSEEFYDTLQRVVEGTYQIQQRQCALVGTHWDSTKAQASAQEMFRLMWQFKFLPPGRGLWMMGTEFVKQRGSACLQNCAFSSSEDIDRDFASPFTFLMDMSMLGVGVGGDVRGAGKVIIGEPLKGYDIHIIEDSREGWVRAVERLLKTYVGAAATPTQWDYSCIRAEGLPLHSFGGTSAGAEPLRQLIEHDIPSVLDPLIGETITAAAIVDLFNFIGRCVVAGSKRRTAEIMFGDPDDEFMDLKNPELHAEELQDRRWASNNSVFAHVGMDYAAAAKRIAANGEPGFMWLDHAQRYGRMADVPNNTDMRVRGGNPCLEQSLEIFELCCLCETFPAHHETYAEYEHTLKFAYLYAKTVTLVPTHDARTNAVMMRNRRIGLSQSGVVQSFAKHGRRTHFKWCDDGYHFVRALDDQYSEWLGVPRSVKVTSIKPSGTISKLCDATCGMHRPPSQYYIQRVRFSPTSELLHALTAAGYPSEPSMAGDNTIIVEFPTETPDFTEAETDVSMWQQIADAAALQRYWADNQVSCTVKFDNSDPAHAAREIAAALSAYEDKLKGISFLPHAHGYAQAPWEPITRDEYHVRVAALSPLDLGAKDTHEVTERFCDGDTCTLDFGTVAA